MPEAATQPSVEKKREPYKALFHTPKVVAGDEATRREVDRRAAQVSEMLAGGPFPGALQKVLEEPPFKVEPPVSDETGQIKKALGRLQGQKAIGFVSSAPTLSDFFHNAETASEGHSPAQGRAQLVAMKLAGKQLLERLYEPAKVGDIEAQERRWAAMTEEEKLAEAAASMMILKAEMEWLKMRQQAGPQEKTVLPTMATRTQGEAVPISPRDASRLAREFRHFADRADIPQEFRDQLEGAAKTYLDPYIAEGKKVSDEKQASVPEKPVIDEELNALKGGAETVVARKSATEDTIVGLEEPQTDQPEPRKRYGDLSKEEKKRLKFMVGPLRKLELYKNGLPAGEVFDAVRPHLSEVVELSVMKGTLPDIYWIHAEMKLKNTLQALGLLDNSSVSFTHQLTQQLQYALHSNRHENRLNSWKSWFGYWLSWGGVDWLSHLGTRTEVLGKGAKSFIHPRDVVGEEAVKKLIEIRGSVAQAARKAADALTDSPITSDQVVKVLLELVADEFEAVSQFEAEQLRRKEEKRAQKKKKKR